MEKKQDLRVTKTHEAIKKALIQLMEEKGFEAMTVKDIAEKARINRSTFYAYYQYKYHCMSSYESEFMEGIAAIAKRSFNPCVRTIGERFPIAIDIFRYFYRNQDMLKGVSQPQGRPRVSIQTETDDVGTAVWKNSRITDARKADADIARICCFLHFRRAFECDPISG